MMGNGYCLAKRLAAGLRRRLQGAGRNTDSPGPDPTFSDIEYWEWRAQKYGARSVLNLAHSPGEMESVTARQRAILMPLLSQCLNGEERLALDFGCGPGRFTIDLARVVGACVGVDPIARLLEMAPNGPGVEYRRMLLGHIPLEDASVDVVWCCLVLGGLKGQDLTNSVMDIQRVLKIGGLLFLVENTAASPNGERWRFRSTQEYRNLFCLLDLEALGQYEDAGQPISILMGRKHD